MSKQNKTKQKKTKKKKTRKNEKYQGKGRNQPLIVTPRVTSPTL